MTDETVLDGAKATRREWIGLAVIAIPCLIYSMDLTVLHLAVPQITAALKPSASAPASTAASASSRFVMPQIFTNVMACSLNRGAPLGDSLNASTTRQSRIRGIRLGADARDQMRYSNRFR